MISARTLHEASDRGDSRDMSEKGGQRTSDTDLRVNLLVERVKHLERSNRVLKMVVATLIIGIGLTTARPLLPEQVQKEMAINPQLTAHLSALSSPHTKHH